MYSFLGWRTDGISTEVLSSKSCWKNKAFEECLLLLEKVNLFVGCVDLRPAPVCHPPRTKIAANVGSMELLWIELD